MQTNTAYTIPQFRGETNIEIAKGTNVTERHTGTGEPFYTVPCPAYSTAWLNAECRNYYLCVPKKIVSD